MGLVVVLGLGWLLVTRVGGGWERHVVGTWDCSGVLVESAEDVDVVTLDRLPPPFDQLEGFRTPVAVYPFAADADTVVPSAGARVRLSVFEDGFFDATVTVWGTWRVRGEWWVERGVLVARTVDGEMVAFDGAVGRGRGELLSNRHTGSRLFEVQARWGDGTVSFVGGGSDQQRFDCVKVADSPSVF